MSHEAAGNRSTEHHHWHGSPSNATKPITREYLDNLDTGYAITADEARPLIHALRRALELRERIAAEVRVDCVRDRHTLGTHTCVTCERIATRIERGQR